MDFEGWIPNATGNISFSVIGEPLSEGLLFRQQFWSSYLRWILVSQNRRNRDRQVPRRLANILRYFFGPPDARAKRVRRYETLTYTVMAKSISTHQDREGALDGIIAISMPGTSDDARVSRQNRQTADLLAEAAEAYRATHNAVGPQDSVWDGAVAGIRDNSSFCCSFRMLRNGKCFFQVDETKHGVDRTTLNWLMSQCYYFLKDSVHQHYHHRPKTDAIIELTPSGSAPDWRLRTLRNLYRKVIALRRSKSERLLSDALGVMTYANVFRAIFARHDFDRSGVKSPAKEKLPAYYPEDLKSSIEIRRDSTRRENDSRKTDIQYLIGSVLAAVALYVSIYDRFSIGSPARKIADEIYGALSLHPYLIIPPLVIMYVFYALYTGAHDLSSVSFLRRGYRLFAWLPKWISVILGLLITAALAYLAYVSVWHLYGAA